MMTNRIRIAAAASAAVAVLAGCSSSGGGAPSLSTLETKLKNEPQIQTLLDQGGTKAKVTSQLTDCIAKALQKDADPSDLNKYVNGQMNLNDIGGKGKGSSNKAKTDAQTCTKNAIASDKSSSPTG